MVLRPRKPEVDAIVSVLDQEADDVGVLAADVLRASFDLLLKRDLWLVVTVTAPPEGMMFVHGPYYTRRQAEKALASSEIMPVNGRLFIRRLITSTADGSDDDVLF